MECFLRSLVYNAGSATLAWNSPTPLFREAALSWHQKKKRHNYPLCPNILEKCCHFCQFQQLCQKSASLFSPAGILKELVLINKQTPTLIYPVKCPCTSFFICLDTLSVPPFTATVSQASGYYRSGASNLLPIWDGVSHLILRRSVNWSNCIPIITAVDSGEAGELGPLWKIQLPITMETSFSDLFFFFFVICAHISIMLCYGKSWISPVYVQCNSVNCFKNEYGKIGSLFVVGLFIYSFSVTALSQLGWWCIQSQSQ